MLAIPRKQRAMVRKGIKRICASQIDADADAPLRHLFREPAQSRHAGVLRSATSRRCRTTFGEACDIVTVLHEGAPVASVLNFYFRDEVLPYYGGGTLAARAVAGNDFMYWEVMERARERGAKLFDYGRSKRGTGAFDFKVHWGFEPEPLYYEYFLVAPHSCRT